MRTRFQLSRRQRRIYTVCKVVFLVFRSKLFFEVLSHRKVHIYPLIDEALHSLSGEYNGRGFFLFDPKFALKLFRWVRAALLFPGSDFDVGGGDG